MYQRKKIPLVDLDGSYKMKHFYMSPGLTFMLPNLQNKENDTINAFGRIAFNLEAGIYRIFKDGGNVFNYMDYGIGYKKLSGAEKNPEKVLHLLKLLDDIVQKGRSTPGEALSNDREVSFLPKGVMLPAKK